MPAYSDVLNREFDAQLAALLAADEIVLYGRSVLFPVLHGALTELGLGKEPRLFDKGRFVDGQPVEPGRKRAVVLCGMRAQTRRSMRRDAENHFPGAECMDFFALYYRWLQDCVKRDCSFEILAQTLQAVREERTIHNIDSINTGHCNLNCAECSNGMPYRRDKKRISVERNIQSLRSLTQLRPIAYCNLQGGEPFLDRDLAERLLRRANDPRIAFLSLATNGTILPDDGVMRALRNSGTMLRISDYGPLSKRKNELAQRAARYAVPCDTYPRAETWVSYGSLRPHGRTPEENKRIAESCHFGTKDLMLYDDRLYCCCRALFANAVGVDNDAVRANTLLLSDKLSAEELDRIVYGRELYRMCDYCDHPMRSIRAAEQAPRRSRQNV